jgi:anti-sigma factor RsiW
LSSISGYVDGDLEAALCAELERHLASCENCRVVVDTLRRTVTLYHTTAEAPALPGAVRERLYKCLDLEQFIKK